MHKVSVRGTDGTVAVSSIFKRIFQDKEEQFMNQVSVKRRKLRHEHYLRDCVAVEHKERHGDKRLAGIRKTLTQFGLTRSKMQVTFHEAFLQAVSQHLYKDDRDVDFGEIQKRNHWDNMKQQVLCLTPRRFGKTTAVSMFVAAYCWNVPKSVQSIFSTGRRASYKLLQQVREMLMKLPGAAERVGTIKNKEDLYIQGENEHDVRKISSYPGMAKTLRGVGGDVIYLEEAAFLALDVFYEVIVPLLEMDTTALIGISTPQDDQNFYSEMFELKDGKGEMFFNTIEIGLVCERCKKGPDPTSCTHMSTWIPPWKSVDKLDMVKALYGSQKDLLARESMGQTTQDLSSVFKMAWVTSFLRRDQFMFNEIPQVIFTACDPSGSGTSEMSIISITMMGGQVCVVAMDAYPQKGFEQIEGLLTAHIDGIRSVPEFADAWIVFIPESNLGNEASHMKKMLSKYVKLWTWNENGRDGLLTTNTRKILYAAEGCRHLGGNSIHIYKNLLLSNPYDHAPYAEKKNRVLKELKTQLLKFSKIVKPRGHGKPIIIYSGKGDGSENDDFVLAFLIALYGGALWISRKTTFPYDMM